MFNFFKMKDPWRSIVSDDLRYFSDPRNRTRLFPEVSPKRRNKVRSWVYEWMVADMDHVNLGIDSIIGWNFAMRILYGWLIAPILWGNSTLLRSSVLYKSYNSNKRSAAASRKSDRFPLGILHCETYMEISHTQATPDKVIWTSRKWPFSKFFINQTHFSFTDAPNSATSSRP